MWIMQNALLLVVVLSSALGFADEPRVSGPNGETYVLRESLGEGGFGEVYIADRIEKDKEPKQVAIKVIPANKFRNGYTLVSKLQSQAGIDSQNLLKIRSLWSVGVDLNGASESYVVVQDLHRPLDQITDRLAVTTEDEVKTAASLDLIERLIADLTSATASLYAAGLVHGDISPKNILADRSNESRFILADFDTTTIIGESVRGYTSAYASPELRKGFLVATVERDLWAMSMTIFRIVNGRYIPLIPEIDGRGVFVPETEVALRQLNVLFKNIKSPDLKKRAKRISDFIVAGLEYLPERRLNAMIAISNNPRFSSALRSYQRTQRPSIDFPCNIVAGAVPSPVNDDGFTHVDPDFINRLRWGK